MNNSINELIKKIDGADKVYIQPHNMPDPDAIASSFALKELLAKRKIPSNIIYMNEIERINSIKMMEFFGIKMEIKDKEFTTNPKDYIILIDSQVGNSNLTSIEGNKIAVIDHHKDLENYEYDYKDIRPDIGACSTVIAQYYYQAEIEPSAEVATALLYGIMNDTNNLTRNTNQKDLDSFYWLYGIANLSKIKNLRMNEIGRQDLNAYAKALENYEQYGSIGFVGIENCNDSLLGTISDMVYKIEGTNIVVSYALRDDGIKFSVRSGVKEVNADDLVKFIIDNRGVGGGHKEMAGGFVPVNELDFLKNKQLDTYVRFRTIAFVEKKNIC